MEDVFRTKSLITFKGIETNIKNFQIEIAEQSKVASILSQLQLCYKA